MNEFYFETANIVKKELSELEYSTGYIEEYMKTHKQYFLEGCETGDELYAKIYASLFTEDYYNVVIETIVNNVELDNKSIFNVANVLNFDIETLKEIADKSSSIKSKTSIALLMTKEYKKIKKEIKNEILQKYSKEDYAEIYSEFYVRGYVTEYERSFITIENASKFFRKSLADKYARGYADALCKTQSPIM